MEWDKIAGRWNQVKGKVQRQWGQLTDDDVDSIAGRRDELIGKVRQRYGFDRATAEREIDEWTRTLYDLEGEPETDAPIREPKPRKR
ncbi:MAG TPA: CsbD family protein [Candidatus Binatia bacterium]|jgi:uncharacterized protein YjbJ (UPF0337 family)